MKLPATFLRFQTKDGVLKLNKSKNTGENAFNGGLFEIEDNHGQSEEENTWF